MGYSNPDSGCRRHPKQKQLPGICSSCLRERLSRLSSENISYKTSNYTFSSESESETEPEYDVERRRSNRHLRNGSDVPAAPMGFVLHQGGGSGNGDVSGASGKMKKSRSVAWPSRAIRRGSANANADANRAISEEEDKGKSGKKGLWKKLIHSTSKKTKGVLMHSLTVRERDQSHEHN